MTMNGLDTKQYKYIVYSSKLLYHDNWVSKHKYHWLDSFISAQNTCIPNLFLNVKIHYTWNFIKEKLQSPTKQNYSFLYAFIRNRLHKTRWYSLVKTKIDVMDNHGAARSLYIVYSKGTIFNSKYQCNKRNRNYFDKPLIMVMFHCY